LAIWYHHRRQSFLDDRSYLWLAIALI